MNVKHNFEKLKSVDFFSSLFFEKSSSISAVYGLSYSVLMVANLFM